MIQLKPMTTGWSFINFRAQKTKDVKFLLIPFFQNKEIKAEKLKEKKEQEKLEEEKARAAALSLRGQREPSFYSRSVYFYFYIFS